jgi:hypothetical protein
MNGEFRRADVDICFFFSKKEFREGNVRNVNVWLQSRPLPALRRLGLEVHRCVCIIDAGNVFISMCDSLVAESLPPTMNFKTLALARREGTTLKPNIRTLGGYLIHEWVSAVGFWAAIRMGA